MIIRQKISELRERISEPRRFIQVLAGARQIGKTTLIKQLVASLDVPYTFVSADAVDEEDTLWIPQQWQAARTEMRLRQADDYLLIIDEVQKIRNWSEQVKREWDADTFNDLSMKVILLGSSRLLLKDGLTESLMGRYELIRMTHWDYPEMRDAFGFSLEQYIYFGGYPGAAPYIGQPTRWRNYLRDSIIEPSISRDVLMTKRIYKPALLRQAFDVGCAYSSELLSYNKMLGQLQDAGNSSTLASYMQTLEEANLLGALQRYANDYARRNQSVPKLQVFNNAFLSYYQGRGFEKELRDPQRWGRWVESAVGCYLLNHAAEIGYQVYYWRERDKEVDFILKQDNGICVAIEVKSGRRQDNQGLHTFNEHFHPTASLVVGSGAFSLEQFFSTPIERLLEVLVG